MRSEPKLPSDRSVRTPSHEDRAHTLGCLKPSQTQRFVRVERNMRSQDNVVEHQKRMLGVRWFNGQYVESGAGRTSSLQRFGKRVFVDQAAASGVDEEGSR